MRPGAAIEQPGLALGPITANPLVRGRPADSELLGNVRHRPACGDPSHEELSAEDAQPRSRMSHARALSSVGVRHPNRSTRALVLSTMCLGTTPRPSGLAREVRRAAPAETGCYVQCTTCGT